MLRQKVVIRKSTEYNGMQFDTLATMKDIRNQYAVSVADKLTNVVPLTLQVHKSSYKYDREIFLSSWSFGFPVMMPRGVEASKYWRQEQYLATLKDTKRLHELKEFFLDCACACDAALKGLL